MRMLTCIFLVVGHVVHVQASYRQTWYRITLNQDCEVLQVTSDDTFQDGGVTECLFQGDEYMSTGAKNGYYRVALDEGVQVDIPVRCCSAEKYQDRPRRSGVRVGGPPIPQTGFPPALLARINRKKAKDARKKRKRETPALCCGATTLGMVRVEIKRRSCDPGVYYVLKRNPRSITICSAPGEDYATTVLLNKNEGKDDAWYWMDHAVRTHDDNGNIVNQVGADGSPAEPSNKRRKKLSANVASHLEFPDELEGPDGKEHIPAKPESR